MKAVYLQLKVEKKQSILFVTLEPGWVENILNKGIDIVLYVDFWEVKEHDLTSYEPTTWIAQKKKLPFSFGDKDISSWLPTRFDKINNLTPGKDYFWFTNLPKKGDCSEEIKGFLLRSGVGLVEMDIRQARSNVDIDAILAKLRF